MQNQLLYISIIFAVVITVILIYFFASIIRYHRRYMKLQRERILAEITIQENERKRIATDLHDSLGPLLSAVKLNINSIDIQPEDQNILDRKGLAEAVKDFVGHLPQTKSINIQIYIVKNIQVPKEKEIHVFRMLQ